jgi:hypothetical protein
VCVQTVTVRYYIMLCNRMLTCHRRKIRWPTRTVAHDGSSRCGHLRVAALNDLPAFSWTSPGARGRKFVKQTDTFNSGCCQQKLLRSSVGRPSRGRLDLRATAGQHASLSETHKNTLIGAPDCIAWKAPAEEHCHYFWRRLR